MREPMTDADLDTLIGHAEYGHFEGQDYDAVETLVAEVRRLRAEVAGADENVASWQGIAADLREERDHYRDGIATQRDAALSETLVAEVRRLRDVLHDLDDFTARHRGPSRFDHDHVCYEAWMMLHARVRTLIGDDHE